MISKKSLFWSFHLREANFQIVDLEMLNEWVSVSNDTYQLSLILELDFGIEFWNWILELNFGIEYWNWILELNFGIEFWNWILELNVAVWNDRQMRRKLVLRTVHAQFRRWIWPSSSCVTLIWGSEPKKRTGWPAGSTWSTLTRRRARTVPCGWSTS